MPGPATPPAATTLRAHVPKICRLFDGRRRCLRQRRGRDLALAHDAAVGELGRAEVALVLAMPSRMTREAHARTGRESVLVDAGAANRRDAVELAAPDDRSATLLGDLDIDERVRVACLERPHGTRDLDVAVHEEMRRRPVVCPRAGRCGHRATYEQHAGAKSHRTLPSHVNGLYRAPIARGNRGPDTAAPTTTSPKGGAPCSRRPPRCRARTGA